MVQRSVTVTDMKVTRSGDGSSDVGLGFLSRTLEIKPSREPRRDRRRQCATRAVQTRCRDAPGRKAHDVALSDQQIDAFIASAVSTFDEHVARTKRKNFAPLNLHLPL